MTDHESHETVESGSSEVLLSPTEGNGSIYSSKSGMVSTGRLIIYAMTLEDMVMLIKQDACRSQDQLWLLETYRCYMNK